MSEVELIAHKDFLICPTPVCTQVAPGSPQCQWRSSFYIYTSEREQVRNIPGTAGFPTREAARECALEEARRMIDEGITVTPAKK